MSQLVFDPVWAPPQPYLSYMEQTKDEENKKRCNLAQVQGTPHFLCQVVHTQSTFYRLTTRRRADDIVAL